MKTFEESRKSLVELVFWFEQNRGGRNEATTRLQLIDRLFFECLGWTRDDVVLEESQDTVYADYTFLAPRRALIVEAKKEGDYFELPAGELRFEHSLPSLFRDHGNVKFAVQQAAKYCQGRGVPLGCVANGHQVIVFMATRSDGLSPLEGKALVFASLKHMESHFLELWQALSKPGVEEKKLFLQLLGEVKPALPPKLSASVPIYPGVKGRNPLQADLQIVSDLVIEDVVRSVELESKFLSECYCESGALSQHSLMAKNILEARYASLFEPEQPGPSVVPVSSRSGISPEIVAESLSRRPIILIGDVGVGKTTFLRRLITVEAAALMSNSLSLFIDLGSKATLTNNLAAFVPSEIQRQLRDRYNIDVEEANFVRGVYNLELKRFEKSIHGELRDTDRASYRKAEMDFLLTKVNDKSEHLRQSLNHLARGRRKQIVIFLDNSDQRGEEIQQQAFLIAQEIAQHWNSTVFVSLRPETFNRSVHLGALSGYHPKAFSIAPPRVDRVIERRLKFALKLTSGEIALQTYGSHARLNLTKLDGIIRSFLNSLDSRPELQEFIENIAGGNVRLALEFVEQFFGSGHVDTQKILEKIEKTGGYLVPLHEFIRAIIHGDAEYYDPAASPVANIFDLVCGDPKEHFILPILIATLANIGASHAADGFVEVEEIYEPMQHEGFTPEQIDLAIVRAHRKRLLETSTRLTPSAGEAMPRAMRATSVGVYHVKKLAAYFAYVDAVLVDTPIFPSAVGFVACDEREILRRVERAAKFRDYLDEKWNELRGPKRHYEWNTYSQTLKADIERVRDRAEQSKRKGYLL